MIFAAPIFLHAKAFGGRRKDMNFGNTAQVIHVHPLFLRQNKNREVILFM